MISEGARGMAMHETIKNSSELEFAVFCIENVASKLGVNAEKIFQAFTEQSDILNGYILCLNTKCSIRRVRNTL